MDVESPHCGYPQCGQCACVPGSGELSCVRTGEGWRRQSIVTTIVIIGTVNSDLQHWLDHI